MEIPTFTIELCCRSGRQRSLQGLDVSMLVCGTDARNNGHSGLTLAVFCNGQIL